MGVSLISDDGLWVVDGTVIHDLIHRIRKVTYTVLYTVTSNDEG